MSLPVAEKRAGLGRDLLRRGTELHDIMLYHVILYHYIMLCYINL